MTTTPGPSDMSEHHPLAGVHDETIYHVLNDQYGQSWFDKCNALEVALVKAGWSPPVGHPLHTNSALWELLDAAKYLTEISDVIVVQGLSDGEAAALKRGYDALDAAINTAQRRPS